MAELTKTEQEAESKSRQDAEAKNKRSIDPATERTATDVLDDGPRGDEGGDPAARAKTAETQQVDNKPTKPAKSEKDMRRDDIVSRFRIDRTTEKAEQADEITQFARSGMPPEFEETNTPVVEQPVVEQEVVQEQPAVQPQKVTVTVKVRGQEMELTQDQLIANAQKALAGESYLEEGRKKVNELDDLIAKARTSVARVDQGAQHPATQTNTQTTEPVQPQTTDGQQPDDPLDKLVETIQFGDPADVKPLLRNAIATEARKATVESLQTSRLMDEGARTQKVIDDFKAKNKELAADPMAHAAIEARVLALQEEDLRSIGVDPTKIQTPGNRPVTPGDVAMAHRFYRSQGINVRKPQDLLETAAADFLKWKGGSIAQEPTVETAPKAEPRIEVTVDRTARRTNVAQQPSRTVTPKVAVQQPAQARDRSSIVQQEIARRSAPRGKVAVNG